MSRFSAEMKYSDRRYSAYDAAVERLDRLGDVLVGIGGIDQSAIDYFLANWTNCPERAVHFQWDGLYEDYRSYCPERFDVAIWSGEVLCGLALGGVSPGPMHASVDFMEGNPDPAHPLKGKIIPIVITVLEAYAIIIGKGEVRLNQPTETLIPIYESFGFNLENAKNRRSYMFRKV